MATIDNNDSSSNKSIPEKDLTETIEDSERQSRHIDPEKPITEDDLAAVPGGVKASELFEDAAPILALNLPDWRKTEKKLVRTLDITLLPILWLLYWNNYLDRTNLAQAQSSEPSMGESLNFEPGGEDYNTAVSLLTVGYMIMQLPSNMLLTRKIS
jgi:hypothetical protein